MSQLGVLGGLKGGCGGEGGEGGEDGEGGGGGGDGGEGGEGGGEGDGSGGRVDTAWLSCRDTAIVSGCDGGIGGGSESTSDSGETSERRCSSARSAASPSELSSGCGTRRASTRWSRNGAASLRSTMVAIQSAFGAPPSKGEVGLSS